MQTPMEYTPVTGDEVWEELLKDSDSKLVIIDVHMDWCGPCDATRPCFNKSLVTYKKALKRMSFYSADQRVFNDRLKKLAEVCVDDDIFALFGCCHCPLVV